MSKIYWCNYSTSSADSLFNRYNFIVKVKVGVHGDYMEKLLILSNDT